jgi:hypothetical protein
MRRILALAIGLTAATSASAMKGGEFAKLIESFKRANGNDAAVHEDIMNMGMFAGYVRGVEDSMQGYRFCIPPQATFGERAALIESYVQEHPDELHNGATTLIVQALQPAYPCSREETQEKQPQEKPAQEKPPHKKK